MIIDSETNTVFFSNLIPEDYKQESDELFKIIEGNGYKVELLVETEDYYARDYMPLQVENDDFVQFVFRPDRYFWKADYKLISNPVSIHLFNQKHFSKPRFSNIILDGGNIIKWKGKVIITDRVIEDNLYQFKSEEVLIKKLEEDLRCKVLLIEQFPGEETGHADGLIRFIDGNTVFINAPDPKQMDWENRFRKQLDQFGLKYIELPCPMDDKLKNADGLYINYLHVGDLIIVPQFGFKDDDLKAMEIIKSQFPNCKVISFRANWIAEFGGVFNCVSWNIKS